MPARITTPVAERLADNSVPEPNTGCVLWLCCVDTDGYGMMSVDGKRKLTHRLAYEVAYGPIPTGAGVLHKCDVPSCINHRHLYAGSQADNVRDTVSRNRLWQQRVTHCPYGHPYDAANTYQAGTNRLCKECRRRRGQEREKTPECRAQRLAYREGHKGQRDAYLKRYRSKAPHQPIIDNKKENTWQPSTSTNPAQPSSRSTSSPTGETLTSAF